MDNILRFIFLLITYTYVNDFISTIGGQVLQPYPTDLRKVFFRLWTPESGSSDCVIFYNVSNIEALLDHHSNILAQQKLSYMVGTTTRLEMLRSSPQVGVNKITTLD